MPTSEGFLFLDPEADPKYDNVRPGTITIEGFGMECWDYEECFGKRDDKRIMVTTSAVPNIPAKKLLRRIDELKDIDPRRLGRQDDEDLREFMCQE